MTDTTTDYKVMRRYVRDFVSPVTASPTLLFCGLGFTQFDEAPGTNIETGTAYICDKNTSPSVNGYERTFPYAMDMHKGANALAIDLLTAPNRQSLTGSDAEVYYYRTDESQATTDEDDELLDIPCRRFKCAVESSDITGAGLESLKTSGTLHQVGDETEGTLTFDAATKTGTFTAT